MSDMTLTERYVKTCRERSDQEIMRIKEAAGWELYTYGVLLESSLKVAAWLFAQGFERHDKAAVIMDNSPQWAVCYFGILLAGGIAVPLDIQASQKDIATLISDAQARFLFTEEKISSSWGRGFDDITKTVVLGLQQGGEDAIALQDILHNSVPRAVEDLPVLNPDDTASILYSSGTTSDPKGIELSHKNLVSNFEGIHALKICSSKDVFISILPLFHAYSFMATLLYPLFLGCKIVYPKTMQSDALLSVMKETEVTILVGVPELFYKIHKSITDRINALSFLQRTLLRVLTGIGWTIKKATGLNILKNIYKPVHARFGEQLRYLISGGARLDPAIALGFQTFGFEILEGYGLTETSPIVSINLPAKVKIGSVGKPLPGVQVKIENPNEEGIGEILIQGDNVMKGYYRKPRAYAEAVKGGWFYSGDLGRLDQDGYIYISGRNKEVIVLKSGKNIFPDEIEKYYSRSKFIKELGVFLSEKAHDDSLKAVVVPNFDAFKEVGQVNVQFKLKWDIENISKELPTYKRIMGFCVSKDELPKTRLGKIKHFLLPEIYENATDEAAEEKKDSPWEAAVLGGAAGQKVIAFLKKELKLIKEIHAQDHLELDLGVDSLSRVELIAGLEKTFGFKISDDQLTEIATVIDLVTKVEALVSEGGQADGGGRPKENYWQDVLFAEHAEDQFEAIDLHPNFLNRMIAHVIRTVIFTGLKITCRLKVFERENIEPDGPYIFCCNHASYLDAFVVEAALPSKVAFQTYYIGWREIFDHPTVKWTKRLARLVSIDPSTELIKAMRAASFILKNNKIICIFPEGQRSIDGEVKEFKKGIGILCKELKIPVVPVALWGAHQAWPRADRPRPHPIKIIFGRPFTLHEIMESTARKEGADEYQRITDFLKEKVIELQAKIKD